MPPAAGHCKPARFEPLPSGANLSQDVAVLEIAFGQFEHRRIADGADLQASDIGAAEGSGGSGCARSDHIDRPHAEADEFRHRYQLVEGRTVDAEGMNVAADHVGEKPSGQHRLSCAKAK